MPTLDCGCWMHSNLYKEVGQPGDYTSLKHICTVDEAYGRGSKKDKNGITVTVTLCGRDYFSPGRSPMVYLYLHRCRDMPVAEFQKTEKACGDCVHIAMTMKETDLW